MRCRIGLCQRLAAQLNSPSPQSSLWITDDVLAEAFDRYVHVSNRCVQYQQHRSTSNVPGPLEARRRLNKRRMGMQTVAGTPTGAGFDLGALFGLSLGSTSMPDPQATWKWEPPSTLPLQYGLGIGNPPAPPTVSVDARPLDPKDVVRKSAIAFDGLVQTLANRKETIREGDLGPILAFLRSDADEIAAHNIRTLCLAIMDKPLIVEASTADALMKLVLDKIRLATLHNVDFNCFVSTIPALATVSESGDTTERSLEMFQALWAALDSTLSHGERGSLSETARQALIAAVRTSCRGWDAAYILLSILRSSSAQPLAMTIQLISDALDSIPESKGPIPDFEKRTQGQLIDILDEMEINQLRGLITAVTVNAASQSEQNQENLPLEQWLQTLEKCTWLAQRVPSAWHDVYEVLAKHVWPSQLSRHLESLPEKYVARLVARHWLPHAYMTNSMSKSTTKRKKLRSKFRVPQYPGDTPTESLDHNQIEKEFRHTRIAGFVNWSGRQTAPPFIRLIAVFERYGIPSASMQNDICTLILGNETPERLIEAYNYIKNLIDHPRIKVSASAASKVLRKLLQSGDVGRALRIFEMVPTLSVLNYPSLPIDLIRAHRAPPHRIFRILLRQPQQPNDIYLRQKHLAGNSSAVPLSADHIDLVEHVASAYACQKGCSWRVSYRRVWECYRFLADRGAPVSRAISRSFVRTGIIRAIEEEAVVIKGKFLYILHLVRELEGEEVAKALDRLVYQLKKPDLNSCAAGNSTLRWAGRKSTSKPEKKGHARDPFRWRRYGWYNPRKIIMRRLELDYPRKGKSRYHHWRKRSGRRPHRVA